MAPALPAGATVTPAFCQRRPTGLVPAFRGVGRTERVSADRTGARTVPDMPTEAPPVFYLFCLQLLLMEEGRPRVWQRIRSDLPTGGRTTHWVESEGLYYGEVLGNRSAGWLMVTNVLTYADGDVRRVGRVTDLPGFRDPRPAKRALLAELDHRLQELRTALLAHTGMTPAAARIFTEMCRSNWRLYGDAMVAAAEAAKAAVAWSTHGAH